MYDAGPKAGRFTADVEFKADFENAANPGIISGPISNFRDGAGAGPQDMDTWEVVLSEMAMDQPGAGFATLRSGATAAPRPV